MTQHEHSREKRLHGETDPHCLEVFARLSEYLDGDLQESDCREIEAHLQGCEPCIEFLKSLRRSIEAAHQFEGKVEPQHIPAELESKLKAAWQEALARRRRT